MTDLITLKDPRAAAAEAFRVLRTNIQFSALDQPIHTLLITSAAADDGKSVTAANLAVTMAQGGSRVILVDADLRRPTQHTLWKRPNDQGLTTAVLANAERESLPLQETAVDGLRLLTSGAPAPNPADLLGSKRLENLIAALKAQADYVIFDAPPVLAAADAPLLATKLDAVLLVLQAGSTRRDHAQRAKEALQRVNARIIGAALTNAPRDSSLSTYGKV
ncbi:MAG: capsular biosynthesis protein [Candidatus Thermofonsia Clade 1 bacterium]|jgi:non-specific protein-tyrosine kinase|uniref:non-specific protein-tyrosine kinase n=1 Tax=Candidatus Thermofonsia Clade 1 bacterium TaxID=2364210 RepID=A0A2M8PDW1_9CHLR|nr:MAG: capsular biosynthesis protein [Candidatus Thermofonsia Clade 1 bacterium]RMF48809.1 MAG: polysaccharide biosynthesis tyrosine autokinase [Chloroflexota bacterium]